MSWETIRDLVRDEWLILSLLLLWSLVGLTIICERVYALWNVLPKSEAFKNKVVGAIEAAISPRPPPCARRPASRSPTCSSGA